MGNTGLTRAGGGTTTFVPQTELYLAVTKDKKVTFAEGSAPEGGSIKFSVEIRAVETYFARNSDYCRGKYVRDGVTMPPLYRRGKEVIGVLSMNAVLSQHAQRGKDWAKIVPLLSFPPKTVMMWLKIPPAQADSDYHPGPLQAMRLVSNEIDLTTEPHFSFTLAGKEFKLMWRGEKYSEQVGEGRKTRSRCR